MKVNLHEFTIGIESDLVTSTSPNYRPPSWPPPRDWPVSIDKNGVVISRWDDPRWDLTPWAGKRAILNFGDDKAGKNGKSEPLDAENAYLMRLIATWFTWGPRAARTVASLRMSFSYIKQVIALCSRNGISAAHLMRFPKVFEQVPGVIAPSNYDATITQLHNLYDAHEVLGFTIVDRDGLKQLVAAKPDHERVQTPYIPPRIWLYQVARLHECLTDYLANREQVELCFRFCLDHYINYHGSLEAALKPGKNTGLTNPFDSGYSDQKDYPGKFPEIADRFGVAGMLTKWVDSDQEKHDILAFSSYLSMVNYAALAYVCNFTLQRREEVASLRASCLLWEEDEKLGRVPIICGETTKTDLDSDARWVTSPSVEIAIHAASSIAHLRMICDRANPLIHPTAADQDDPYLLSTATEPWGPGLAWTRSYDVRRSLGNLGETLRGTCSMLLDPKQMRITAEDLKTALRLTPNLPEDDFAVGKIWPLSWHQYRRTGAVNMFASGSISDSTIQQQLKHCSRLMPLYYGRNHSNLHFNQEVQTAVIMAMYQAQAEIVKVVASDDRFMSPHSPERKEALAVNVLSAKDTNALISMAKKGSITFREHRLGGCMKAGVCEYGGIESVARCAGGDGGRPCTDVLYDRTKEPQIRADLRRITEEIKLLSPGQPRYNALVEERLAMENYLNVISVC